MFAGRPLTTHIPPLQHQPDVNQEEQQHKHPLRGDGHVADEGGHGQLRVKLVNNKSDKTKEKLYHSDTKCI